MNKVFIINLEKDSERKKYISNHFQERGIDFEFIKGIYGKSLTQQEIEDLSDLPQSARCMGKELSLNELGCALSHKKAYKMIIEKNLDGAFIFEDDIILSENIKDILESIHKNKKKLPKESWVGLSNSYIRVNKKLFDLFDQYKIYQSPKVRGALGYYIDYAGAKKLLGLNKKTVYVADWFTGGYIDKLNIYSINSACVMQNISIESSIDQTRINSSTRPSLIYRLIVACKRINAYKFSILKPFGFYKKVKYSSDLEKILNSITQK